MNAAWGDAAWSVEHGPDSGTAQRRRRGLALAVDALPHAQLRTSPLGPEWSSDVDAYVASPSDPFALRARGWLPLGPLLARLGLEGRDRWAVVDGEDVLTAVDIHVGEPPDAVAAVVARALRRGEVHEREIRELEALGVDADRLPFDGPVMAFALRIARLRRVVGRMCRRRRFTVAVTGVDGAGKSTLVSALAEALTHVGVPTSVVWARPGMRLRTLRLLATTVKRVLRQPAEPTLRAVAAGRAATAPSRCGVVGWAWAMAVTVAHLVDVWRRHLVATGVTLYDRHLDDALVTLDVLYAGVDLRAHRSLLQMAYPRADLQVYLAVPLSVAVERKPGDPIGSKAVRRQLRAYRRRVGGRDEVLALDATAPPSSLRLAVLCQLCRFDDDHPATRPAAAT